MKYRKIEENAKKKIPCCTAETSIHDHLLDYSLDM